MAVASTTQVLAATRQWLKPVVNILIRCGITWREFSALAKTTYVEVASSEFGKRGRPTNVSRTAVLTGLARRDVRKARELVAQVPEAPSGYVTKASLVLSLWHQDAKYLDKQGKPALLRFDGKGATFTELAQRCAGGDVAPSTLLKELRSAGAVRERADGKLEALQRSYIPFAMDEQLIRLWGTVLADVAATYVHNLTRQGKTPARFERAAVNERIPPSALPAFRAFLEKEGQGFLERVDAWLTAHEAGEQPAEGEKEPIRLGVGVYHIQD